MAQGTPPRRIAVVGTSGSGKTVFAEDLARRLGVPHVELDAIHWGPSWTPLPVEDFRQRTAESLSADAWTTDGNYSKVRDIVWGRAEAVIWLDYNLPLVLWRVVSRTVRRSLSGEELWNGNREHLGEAMFSRDSIVLWALRSYPRRKREYPVLFRQPEYAHLQVVRLRSPRQASAWLETIAPRTGQVQGGVLQ